MRGRCIKDEREKGRESRAEKMKPHVYDLFGGGKTQLGDHFTFKGVRLALTIKDHAN